MTTRQISSKMDTTRTTQSPTQRDLRPLGPGGVGGRGGGAAAVEWHIKLFLGVHFAANWVSVPEGFLEGK